MKRFLGLATALAILFSGLSAPVASADECLLQQTETVVTGLGTCTGAITIPAGVTTIGPFAFANSEITSITIPTSVTLISSYAFFNTSFMATVTVDVGSGLETIGAHAFLNATALTSITIPASVASIGHLSFSNNPSLTSIDVDPANTTYKDISGVLFTYDGSELISYPGGKTETNYVIPAGVALIKASAFQFNDVLQSVTIPASVITISDDAFFASSLQSVIFEAGSQLTTIAGTAFYYSTLLTSITIPATVTSIASSSFAGNTSLASIDVDPANTTYKEISGVLFTYDGSELLTYPLGKTGASYIIPASVVVIRDYAFFSAASLETIDFEAGSNLTTIGIYAFGGNTSLTSITIPAGSQLTSIGNYAFIQAESLISITIPASVTSIGVGAFTGAISLTSVTFAETSSLETIDATAFGFATSLTSITIPASVTTIGGSAFEGTASLASVIFLGSAPTVASYAFSGLATGARAVVNDSATKADFPLVDEKWNGLRVVTVAEAEAEDAAPSVPSVPSAEELAATAREAARVAEAAREDARKQARAELVANSSAPLTVDKFANAGISGITAINLGAVRAEIAALPTDRRGDISEILKIARKFEVVDIVATSSRFNASMLQEIGLIKSDNKNKSSITATLAKLPANERASYAAIENAIGTVMKKIQERKDRLAAIKSRSRR